MACLLFPLNLQAAEKSLLTPTPQAEAATQAHPTPSTKPSIPTPLAKPTTPTPPATPIAQASSTHTNPAYLLPSAPNLSATSYILMDANSGKIIAQKNADVRHPPASLTKLMTLYLTFKGLATGQLHLTDKVTISKKAWKIGGSRMFLRVGTKVSVENLIQGVIVDSGNDATTALAEYVGGTESAFVQLMDQQAQILGMKNTHYTDPTGLPHPNHYSTANDLAVLTQAIIQRFPSYYHFFSEKWFSWNGIRQPNRNRLLWRNQGVDGLKTGHTEAAGYCLITSAKQNSMRLISIIMGAPTDMARAEESQALLSYGFRFFQTKQLYKANQVITITRIYSGKQKQITLGLNKDFDLTLPKMAFNHIKISIDVDKTIKAPIKKGQQLGTIIIQTDHNILIKQPLVALQEVPKGSWWRRFIDWCILLFH
ncbi:MAG: D-alanyl-D-alanine carboxypeptidase [Gammaproteobacteria bacterium]|nr:D-alanyl-D-alanine carboxypeptidase [Gammaproteobacteria bacterium]